MKILLILFFLLSLLAAGEFRIAATADIHGNLRNLAALAPELRRCGADVRIDAGDLVGGNLVAEHDGGSSMTGALNKLEFDFRIPGNHDFEVRQQDFEAAVKNFRGITLGGEWAWGNSAGVPWRIVSKGRFRCGIIGLTEPDLLRRHLPGKDAPRFLDWEKVLRSAVNALRARKVHAVVLVWHNGMDARPNGIRNVIRRFPGIDLVIAAHSHQENPGSSVGRTYVVQPGAYASSAALVRIFFNDRTLKIDRIESALLRGNRHKPAADMVQFNRRAAAPWHRLIHKKICRKGDLSAERFPFLAARAIAASGGTQGAVFTTAAPPKEAAFLDKYKDLYRILPFRNLLCTVKLSREELKTLLTELEHSSRRFNRRIGVHGFTYRRGRKNTPLHIRAPEQLTITVSDFTMTGSAVLRRIVKERPQEWKKLDTVERIAVAEYLKNLYTQ